VLGEPLPRADRGRDHRQHELRVRERSERNPEDAVCELRCELGSHLEAEPRLAAAAGAGEGEEAPLADQRSHLLELPLSADERRRLRRQVRRAQRAKRRERSLAELKDLFRLAEVLEPVQAEVGQRERALDERARAFGEDDLSPVCGGADAGGPVDIDADVAFVG